MVDISHPRYTYKKRGVFYFSKSVPTDLRHHYLKPRIIQSLRTKSRPQARYAAQKLASRLDDYWLNLRLKEAEIPAAHLLRSVLARTLTLPFQRLETLWIFIIVLKDTIKEPLSLPTANDLLIT